jgi:hypothetical protein
MKVKLRYVLPVLAVAAIGVVLYSVMMSGPTEGRYDSFAQCLTNEGAAMYGAYWCPHCMNQKDMFGTSFQYVNYVECDSRGNNAQPALCEQNNIEGYPTWIIDDQRLEGEQSLQTLASVSGCQLES